MVTGPASTRTTAAHAGALRRLEAELGGPAPDGLTALSEAELSAFTGVLAGARARQSGELEVAIEQSLGHVPWLLRGTIRKVLFG